MESPVNSPYRSSPRDPARFAALSKDIAKIFENIHWPIDFALIAKHDHQEISRFLLGILAIRFKVFLHLTEEITLELETILETFRMQEKEATSSGDQPTRVLMLSATVPALLIPLELRAVNSDEDLGNLEASEQDQLLDHETPLEGHDGYIPPSEGLMIAVASIPAFDCIQFPNFFVNLYHCLLAVNFGIKAITQGSATGLGKFKEFLSHSPLSHSIYCTGDIKMKEPHTYVWESSIGPIQIGVPPETIKKSMRDGVAVPKVYVLPAMLFSGDENFGEVEFPIYFNYFMKKAFLDPENRIILIGTKEDLDRIRTIFSESFYGPKDEHIFVKEEISDQKLGYKIDLKAERFEIAAKRPDGSPLPLETFANFIEFDENNTATFFHKFEDGRPGVNIRILNHRGFYQFFEETELKASLDSMLTPHVHRCRDHKPDIIIPEEGPQFDPPTFGVTFLGTSHGFDAKGHTTGFIIWIGGNGILVDPPSYSTEYLRVNGIANSCSRVILTHCHSDHDSGILKKIVEGEKVELYTTKTVNESYKRKMNAVTGLNIGDYYNFVPVPIGKPFKILGAEFEFDYALHTIPCVRFKLNFGGKSIAYSADTYYNPNFTFQLREKGVITPEREVMLNMFLWDADLIIHEAGVPPIHTPIEILNELPTSLKKKMLVVHCHGLPETVMRSLPDGSKAQIPLSNLRIPGSGLKNTVNIDLGPYYDGISHANRRLKMFSDTFIFSKLTPGALYDLYTHCEEEKLKVGSEVITRGDYSDRFYIVYSGALEVIGQDGSIIAKLGRGDSFGENALRKAKFIPRSASVRVSEQAILLSISAPIFRRVLEKDGLEEVARLDMDLRRINRMRPFVKDVLSKTYLFQGLTEEQITFISANLEQHVRFPSSTYIIQEGDTERSMFIIEEGSVRLERFDGEGGSRELLELGVGDIFGELSLITGLPRTCSVVAITDTTVLELKQKSFERLMGQYQNLRIKLAILVEQRLKESQKVVTELRRSTPRTTPSHSPVITSPNRRPRQSP
eukprot:TRINITY_DN4868_c0_g2_i3.p1 TRINITY_DN4868_c0_g2~~TRINITY_DN4868_c0_g2_i3.p1  ORF type:complete len:1018 (-),score=260.94 TRINITY_DN4868_c0_g2_i3:72-3125(-)